MPLLPTSGSVFTERTIADAGSDQPGLVFPAIDAHGTILVSEGANIIVNDIGDIVVELPSQGSYASFREMWYNVQWLLSQIGKAPNPRFIMLFDYLPRLDPTLVLPTDTTQPAVFERMMNRGFGAF